MRIDECQIWPGCEASGYEIPQNDTYRVDSPRAGGKYIISLEAKHRIIEEVKLEIRNDDLEDLARARLTTMLVDQRRMGIEWPEVTLSLVEEAKNAPPLPIYERADRLLRFIADQSIPVSTLVDITESTHGAYAWSESTEWEDIAYLLDYLTERGWIKGKRINHFGEGSGAFTGVVAVEGYRRIEEQNTNLDSSQVFVAMWFDSSMEDAFKKGIEPAIKDAGYVPFKIGESPSLDKIDEQAIAEIRQSRFLVADVTHGDKGARGSVYFEAGFAHGLDIPVIYTCHSNMVDKLHFDTRQYPHLLWDTPEDLRKQLQEWIRALLREGPKKGEG